MLFLFTEFTETVWAARHSLTLTLPHPHPHPASSSPSPCLILTITLPVYLPPSSSLAPSPCLPASPSPCPSACLLHSNTHPGAHSHPASLRGPRPDLWPSSNPAGRTVTTFALQTRPSHTHTHTHTLKKLLATLIPGAPSEWWWCP